MIKILTLLICTILLSQTGIEIAEKSTKAQRGFVAESVESKMILISANGEKLERNLKSITLERDNQEDYSIIQFLNPPDVRGTGLLTHQNPKGDDKQWLYLPELRRTKRISSKNKSGSFMASEFSYEDITGNTIDRFDYKRLEDEKLNDVSYFVVERIPTYSNSGYTKIKTWYDKTTFLPVRSEFTDRKKSLLKVQTFDRWDKIGEGRYRIGTITMTNLQTKKSSVIEFTNRNLDVKLKERQFKKNSLERLIND